jgi:hypothetical protein
VTGFRDQINWRLFPIQIGILATFACIPLWRRFDGAHTAFHPLFSAGFLVFWPMAWTVAWWLLLGLPGFRDLRRDGLRGGWALALLALVVWSFASWSWAFVQTIPTPRPDATLSAAIPFGLAILFALVVACVRLPVRALVLILVINLLWNGLLTTAQSGHQISLGLKFLGEYDQNPTSVGTVIVRAGGVRWLRPYSLMPHPNMAAGILAVGLLAALAWVVSARSLVWAVGMVIFLIGWWGFLLTFSRGAWIGFGAGAFALLPLIWPRLRQADVRLQVSLTGALAVLVTVIFVILFRPFLSARAGIGAESVELRSVSDRNVYAAFAFRAIDESPLIGHGIGNFPWNASYYLLETNYDLRGQPVHHVLLSAWAELGLIGYALVVSAIVLGVEAALRAVRTTTAPQVVEQATGNQDNIACAALLAGFIALAVIGLLDHYPWTLLQFQALWWGLLAGAGAPHRA